MNLAFALQSIHFMLSIIYRLRGLVNFFMQRLDLTDHHPLVPVQKTTTKHLTGGCVSVHTHKIPPVRRGGLIEVVCQACVPVLTTNRVSILTPGAPSAVIPLGKINCKLPTLI